MDLGKLHAQRQSRNLRASTRPLPTARNPQKLPWTSLVFIERCLARQGIDSLLGKVFLEKRFSIESLEQFPMLSCGCYEWKEIEEFLKRKKLTSAMKRQVSQDFTLLGGGGFFPLHLMSLTLWIVYFLGCN